MQTLLLAATVLVIGDSHSVGPFGWSLDQNLRDEGLRVATYASCGSIAQWWSTGKKTPCGYFSKDLAGVKTQAATSLTPIMDTLLKEVNPSHVIVELGTNYANLPSDKFAIEDMGKMAKAIRMAGAKCFWVGAPDMRRFKSQLPRFRKLIEEAVGAHCEVFDSESVTSYPAGGDGIHYWSPAGTPIARDWAKAVSNDFMRSFSL